MISRPAALAAILLLSGCQTVSNIYDGWFGAGPKQKAAELTQFEARATARIVWQGSVGDAQRSAAVLARTPMGRWGEPGDLVGAVLLPCSPAAGFRC